MSEPSEDLKTLADLYGVQTSYHDAVGRLREASAESLLAALAALEAPVENDADVPAALAERRRELESGLVEPVIVAWDGRLDAELRPGGAGRVECHLELEGGGERSWGHDGDGARRLAPTEPLPMGFHRLRVAAGSRQEEALVVAAPTAAYAGSGEPLWGVFLPLYALRTRGGWGAGDLSDLEALAEWTAGLGGGVVGTLPLLAAFLDEPFEPSPYAPASRLFWNELFLDPRRLPEMEESPVTRRLLESPELRDQIESLVATRQVEYERLATLKRRVLEDLASSFFHQHERGSERFGELEAFIAAKPHLEEWAAFRAVGDRRGEPWQRWPERPREGRLAPADYDHDDYRYHLWVQWACDRQVRGMAREARRRGPGLYLDLPLGVNASSYDVWHEGELFAQGSSAGAPPDPFFTKGQSWGFPPVRPDRQRAQGYRYLVECLRHHLEHAGILRIDHVMQFHRLFWIPQGLEAKDGVYVRYPADELFAVLSLESHRHRAMLVGENLGTVPPEIGERMERHGVFGMYVLQYELAPGAGGLPRRPPERVMASLNTHDMPTFRGFWEGRDIADRKDLGLLDEGEAKAERERLAALREEMAGFLRSRGEDRGEVGWREVVRGFLEHLAASPARMLLVNLEDLWGETEPQNVPGTSAERPNWRRKARLTLEELSARPEVVETLQAIDVLRRRQGGRP